jgi:hypothetical protein
VTTTEVHLVGIDVLVREAVRTELATIATQQSPWLDVEGAANHLATTRDAIYSLVKRGEGFPVHRTPNGRLLFRAEELDDWVISGLDPDKEPS